ncbi:MAG: hypothetical protein JNL90_12785 [Planctomycetes bacterium]|nr:hypothetical protein [Planctomycetota bacterium]
MLALLAGACDSPDEPPSAVLPADLPLGLALVHERPAPPDGRPPLIEALPADRPGARVRAALTLRCPDPLPPATLLVIDQGQFDGDRCWRGPEFRYALPELDATSRVVVRRVAADGRVSTLPVQPLARADGWFAVALNAGLARDEALALDLDVASNPLPLELELFAEVLQADGVRRALPGRVPVRIVDRSIDWLRVLLPAQARPGAAVTAKVLFMSGLSGPIASSLDAPVPAGTLEVSGPFERFTIALSPDANGDGRLPTAFDLPLPPLPHGLQRIAVAWREQPAVRGLSNPIAVDAAAAPLWFGNLHSHTAVGGHSSGVPSQALRYARDVTRLDFLSLSEHREAPGYDAAWLESLANEWSAPGRFVVFNGYEWTDADWGHRHALFRTPRAAPPAPSGLPALAEQLGRDPDVLLVGHHSLWNGGAAQRRFLWGEPDTLPRQCLAEVFSWHGSSLEHDSRYPMHGNHEQELPRQFESDILAALRRGHRLFLVADSDNHLGKPGGLIGIEWPKGRRYAFQGVTVVAAPTLDHDALFRALERGDAYGTTGARLRLAATRSTDRVQLVVNGSAPLSAVELRTPTTLLARRDFPAPAPAAATERARLYTDPAAGTFDVTLDFDVAPTHAAEPWIVVVEQHDFHSAWKLLAPPGW